MKSMSAFLTVDSFSRGEKQGYSTTGGRCEEQNMVSDITHLRCHLYFCHRHRAIVHAEPGRQGHEGSILYEICEYTGGSGDQEADSSRDEHDGNTREREENPCLRSFLDPVDVCERKVYHAAD